MQEDDKIVREAISKAKKRIAVIGKKQDDSRKALHAWVAEQNRQLDSEEERVENLSKAIDVEEVMPDAPLVVVDDLGEKFNGLFAEADNLLQ